MKEMTKIKLNMLIDDVCLIILTAPLWIVALMFIYMVGDVIISMMW